MNKHFFEKFIKEQRYLQNRPLKTEDFISFCSKMGIVINKDELEFFEKEGLFFPIIRIDRPIYELKILEDKYYAPISFENGYDLDRWLVEGNLYDPSTKPFVKWSSFKDEEIDGDTEKIMSFYSSFQIHLLNELKREYSIEINLSRSLWNDDEINSVDDFLRKMENNKNMYEDFFDFKKKKNILKRKKINFERILEFLLTIQYFYSPYGRSSAKTITIEDKDWNEKKKNFDPIIELNNLKLSITDIVYYYNLFSRKSIEILGIKEIDDWIYLLNSISWRKKEKLSGPIRLGIEYLSWSLMIKKFIESYCNRNILGIDELRNISWKDILEIDVHSDSFPTYRSHRNKVYYDSENEKNHYYNTYKRLFYLANDFDLNYQPKIMVFVEGETEEELFPKIFEWSYSIRPENLGIEIVNFRGVDKLLSTSQNAEILKNLIHNIHKELKERCISNNSIRKLNTLIKELNEMDIVLSNWTSFISYNLKKWQIIPFFVADDEGNVKHFLDAGKSINFDEGNYEMSRNNYDIPNDWKYLWGVNNENKPFFGNNFEFANFSDMEILLAINEVLGDEINIDKVKEIREKGAGIKKIDERIKPVKREIVNLLFDNLFTEYERTKDDALLNRPIFELIVKIRNLASSNHSPVNTMIELKNKNVIKDLLSGRRESLINNNDN